MDRVAGGQIRFAIHSVEGISDAHDTHVDAGLFARKLVALVRGLRAADKAANGSSRHDYTVEHLHSSAPTVIIAERVKGPYPILAPASGVDAFVDCAQELWMGTVDRTERGTCASYIRSVSDGVGKSFAFAEIESLTTPIRIDPLWRKQLDEIFKSTATPKPTSAAWYKGVAHGSFVGAVKEVDLRGEIPAITLVLSAGGKEINCICRGLSLEEIKSALDKRVTIFGKAIYDGRSGLPRRVEVYGIEHFRQSKDFTHWKGAFNPFEIAEWVGDS